MEQHKEFPDFWTAVLILALLVGLQIIISIIAYDLGYTFQAGDPGATGVITILSCGIMFSLLMSYKKLGYKELFNQSKNSLASIAIALTIPLLLTVGGAVFWISDITNLLILYFPVDDNEYLISFRLMGSGVVSVITVCIIAPFIEEMLFRGIILRSFLVKYSDHKAIFLTSLLFALYHLNIYQLPVAFLIGCLFGWLYVHTMSLWPCILGHALYNMSAMLLWNATEIPNYLDYTGVIEFNAWWVDLFAILASLAGVSMLRKILAPSPT